jgi:DNA polymerase epsilon subunit 2
MLAHNKEGKLCIEDADGTVELDFSKLVSQHDLSCICFEIGHGNKQDQPGEGFFTEGCFALVEGEYTEEATLEIVAIGQPPCEPRMTAR